MKEAILQLIHPLCHRKRTPSLQAQLGKGTGREQMGESARHYAETHLHVDAVLGRFVTRLAQELLLK